MANSSKSFQQLLIHAICFPQQRFHLPGSGADHCSHWYRLVPPIPIIGGQLYSYPIHLHQHYNKPPPLQQPHSNSSINTPPLRRQYNPPLSSPLLGLCRYSNQRVEIITIKFATRSFLIGKSVSCSYLYNG